MNRLFLSAVIIGDLNFLVCNVSYFMFKIINKPQSLEAKKGTCEYRFAVVVLILYSLR